MRKFLKCMLVLVGLGTFFCCSHSCFAQTKIEDEANLFQTPRDIEEQMASVSETTQANLFVVTTDTSGEEPLDFCESYLKEQITRQGNGVVLLINMNLRETYIFATGNIHFYLSAERIDRILDQVQPSLSDGNYEEAVHHFLTGILDAYQAGLPKDNAYKIDPETGKISIQKGITSLEALVTIMLALAVSIAFFVGTTLRYQLKLGTWKYPFREKSTTTLSKEEDILVNSFITTRHIPQNNSGGGGGGGSFSNSSSSGGGRSF